MKKWPRFFIERNSMRVLYLSQTTDNGGATIALRNIIKEINGKVSVAVLVPSNKGWLVDELNQLNCKLYTAEYEMMIYPTSNISKYGLWNPIGYMKFFKGLYNKFYKRIKVAKSLEKIIKEFQPDIVHCNCGPLDIALSVCNKMGILHVWHLREYLPVDSNMHVIPSLSYFKRKLHKEGNYNIAITKGIFKYYNLRERIDEVIYDGVFDESLINEFKDTEKENYFLAVGRIEESKGTLFLLDTFLRFHQEYPTVKLLLAGGFSSKTYFHLCEEFVSTHGLCDNVKFLGIRKDIYSLMKNAMALVVSSPSEGFGFITVEAMLNGCLVIGRNTAGTKEQFDNGLNKYGQDIALRFDDSNQLLSHMKHVMDSSELQMRRLAYQLVVEKYSIQLHIKQLLKFYNRILNDKK